MAADKGLIADLIRIAHAANPPDYASFDWTNVTLPSADGWRVVFFYDCGDLDYIDHFIAPDGQQIHLWCEEIDPRVDDSHEDGRSATIQCWRGCSDTERLLKLLA